MSFVVANWSCKHTRLSIVDLHWSSTECAGWLGTMWSVFHLQLTLSQFPVLSTLVSQTENNTVPSQRRAGKIRLLSCYHHPPLRMHFTSLRTELNCWRRFYSCVDNCVSPQLTVEKRLKLLLFCNSLSSSFSVRYGCIFVFGLSSQWLRHSRCKGSTHTPCPENL